MLEPEHWYLSRPYLYGIDLFNHGYYWEAHEVWEGLWHAAGRRGRTGRFLQALIKLAAAAVKVRQGVPEGVRSHARRAAELLEQIAQEVGGEEPRYLGLNLAALSRFAHDLAGTTIAETSTPGQQVVFGFVLVPVTTAKEEL